MTKQIVTPDEFIRLVNQTIKEHSDYSEDRPIVLETFDKGGYHITFSTHPFEKIDDQIFHDALAKVKETYDYKSDS